MPRLARSLFPWARSWVRSAAAAVLGLSALAASAQPVGHLNVPAMQSSHSYFGATPGLPSNQYHWLGLMYPDGRADPMQPDLLLKQTLSLMDLVFLVVRPNGPAGVEESGEIYLGDVDASLKGRPLQDQLPVVRYTMPAKESRLVLQVTLAAGRAFGGYRQPVIVHYGPAGVVVNARAIGYVVPN